MLQPHGFTDKSLRTQAEYNINLDFRVKLKNRFKNSDKDSFEVKSISNSTAIYPSTELFTIL